MRTSIIIAAAGAALLSWIAPVSADELQLVGGRTVEGTVVEETAEFVVFRTASGAEARFPTKRILKIVRGQSPADEAAARLDALQPGDLRAHKELAAFCQAKKLRKQLAEVRELILQRFPDDAQTRRDLGYVRHEGKWLKREDYMRSLGLVQDGRTWVTPEEAEKRQREERAKQQRGEIERVVKRAATRDAETVRGLLQGYDNAAVVPVLAEEAISAGPKVRKFAIEELGRRKAKEAELALAKAAVKDPKRAHRDAAMEALNGMGDLKQAPGYFLRSVTRERKHAFRRVNAIKAVGAYPAAGAVPVLIRTLRQSTGGFGKASMSVVTERAYIQDFELSSGGTGNIVAEVADPVIGRFQEGVTLEMKVTLWERRTTVDVLRKITGQRFGADPNAWQRWWDGQNR